MASCFIFKRSSHLPVSLPYAFSWHEREGALERMLPPWEPIAVLNRDGNLSNEGLVDIKMRFGPFSFSLRFKHENYVKDLQFQDTQVSGPFKFWRHTHRFEHLLDDPKRSKLTDTIEYSFPFSFLSQTFAHVFIENKLDRMFTYRHRTLISDLYFHSKYSQKSLKILVTGASGLIGTELVAFLRSGGHSVFTLARQKSNTQQSSQNLIFWDSNKKCFEEPEKLNGIDAVIHLAGANIATQRWTEKRKQVITESRVNFTADFCHAIEKLSCPPKVFISASGIGIFGNRERDEVLSESSKLGTNFLAKIAQNSEAACYTLRKKNIRLVHLRFGTILTAKGGLLKKLLLPYRLCLGGKIGSGEQMLPWLSLTDALGIILFSISNSNISGPVNAVSPQSLTNEEFSILLAQNLEKPHFFHIPQKLIEILFGQMGKELLLSGQHAKPTRLLEQGYEFIHTDLHDALSYHLGL